MIQLSILLLLVAFCKFLHRKKGEKYAFLLKIARPHATYDVICHYNSNRLSPNFTKMNVKDKRTATEAGMS